MEKKLIIVTELYSYSNIEPQFIVLLEDEGLIRTEWIDGEQYIPVSELSNIERYARWYYDLSINIEGIDTIRHLLLRMESMQRELYRLRRLTGIEPHKNIMEENRNYSDDVFGL